MQTASDKTFHLKWNNHLQNLSQLFTTIYSSSSLADVTLSCRDGSIHAHKLVLSACSPYFEQIFKENPCKHPTIILKGIPYAEINLLVEFMYKGSVDVQEIDLQSLMHTASELEIRGLAYEVRKDASSLLNVNLNEYPNFAPAGPLGQDNPFPPGFDPSNPTCSSPYNSTPRQVNPYQTNLERLRQIHMYQQAMCRNQSYTTPPQPSQPQSQQPQSQPQPQPDLSAIKRKRKNDEQMPATTTTAVKNILAAAAKELEYKKTTKTSTCIQTEDDLDVVNMTIKNEEIDLDETPAHGRDTRYKGRKRVSVGVEGVEFSPIISKIKSEAVVSGEKRAGLKCVSFQDLKEKSTPHHNDDSSAIETSADENNLLVERAYEHVPGQEEEYDSGDSKTEAKATRNIFKCDLCDQRYSRNSHMLRHRRTHSGERPFKCTSCHYSFTRSSHLARHLRTHTGERPFRCDACGRCFARGDKLKLHMKICEKDEYTLPGNSSAATASMTEEGTNPSDPNSVTSGMVSIGHSERHQLMFTPSGDVMLAPRTTKQEQDPLNDVSANETTSQSITDTSATSPSLNTSSKSYSDKDYPIKRGRGRPRKKPLPPVESPTIKKRRGRPPKIIKIEPSESGNTRSMEIYNQSNLPYGDFSYLTDIMSTHFNQSTQQAYQNMLQLNPMLAVNALQSALSSQAGLPSLMPQALQALENLKNQATLQDKINSTISAQIGHLSAPTVTTATTEKSERRNLYNWLHYKRSARRALLLASQTNKTDSESDNVSTQCSDVSPQCNKTATLSIKASSESNNASRESNYASSQSNSVLNQSNNRVTQISSNPISVKYVIKRKSHTECQSDALVSQPISHDVLSTQSKELAFPRNIAPIPARYVIRRKTDSEGKSNVENQSSEMAITQSIDSCEVASASCNSAVPGILIPPGMTPGHWLT